MSIHPGDKHLIEAFMGEYFTLYDGDWNSIMKVVDKVQRLWDNYPIVDWHNDKDQYYFLEVVGMPIASTQQELLANVVKFVKWYNVKTPNT